MNYDQIIYDIAIKNGFTPQTAKLIIGQARVESANYTSNVFKRDNNMFGMKFVGQKLAQRGTSVPSNEKKPGDVNINYYAKYANPQDSARDVIERLYTKTMGGVTPAQLKTANTAETFSELLKKREYFGGTPSHYANAIKGVLSRIVISTPAPSEMKNRDVIEVLIVIAIISAAYIFLKK